MSRFPNSKAVGVLSWLYPNGSHEMLLALEQPQRGWAFRNLGIADPALAGSFQLSSLTAMVISGVASAICWRTPKVFDFCIETIIETRKVVWPTKKETRDHTVVVIVTSICIALMLWGFDLVFKRLFGVILNLGGA